MVCLYNGGIGYALRLLMSVYCCRTYFGSLFGLGNTMKKIFVVLAVFVLIVIGYAYYSPYMALKNMREAAETQNVEKLSRYIDYDSVRTNLNSQIKTAMVNQVMNHQEMQNNPFAGLALAIVPTMVEQLTEVLVSPEAVGAMIKGANVGEVSKGEVNQANAPKEGRDEEWGKATSEYIGYSQFVVSVVGEGSGPIRFNFNREGLFEWQLKEIRLPDGLFDD